MQRLAGFSTVELPWCRSGDPDQKGLSAGRICIDSYRVLVLATGLVWAGDGYISRPLFSCVSYAL